MHDGGATNFQYDPKARIPSGCSKRLSSKAAASEETRRTLRYVESLRFMPCRIRHGTPVNAAEMVRRQCPARTPLADFFSILLELYGDLIDGISLNDITGFHVVEILDAQAAFIPLLHFTHIVLETP